MSLKVSVSGVRGIWGESLTLDVLTQYIHAFGLFLLSAKTSSRVKVLLGRDGRKTGPLIASYATSLLNAMGIDVLDAGLIPTPSILLGVREWNLDGGIIITASHNPIQWNALKFVVRGGTFTTEADIERVLSFLKTSFCHASWNTIGTASAVPNLAHFHIERVLSVIDVEAVRAKRYKVILDPVNSAGGPITTQLLESLRCHVVGVNTEITGEFARVAEPTPANLAHLSDLVRQHGADVAFAQDPDADRLVVADETGRLLSEEWTLALAVAHVLSKTPGPIAVNLSTSLLSEIIATQYGQPCHYTKVGEANVVEGMKACHAVIGGEGNGGVIYPAANFGRDSLVGIALILEAMAKNNSPLSNLTLSFPTLWAAKEKMSIVIPLDKLEPLIKQEWPTARIDTTDGIRIDMTDTNKRLWLHIRSSNTEPIMRLIGESSDQAWLVSAIDSMKRIINAAP